MINKVEKNILFKHLCFYKLVYYIYILISKSYFKINESFYFRHKSIFCMDHKSKMKYSRKKNEMNNFGYYNCS